MAPLSLLAICARVAIENVNHISSLGNMPERNKLEILAAVQTAKHLRALEEDDDDLLDISGPFWERFIKRDFPLLFRKHGWKPSNPRFWHKVYRKYQSTHDNQVADATAALKNSLKALEKAKNAEKATIISHTQTAGLPKLPRNGGGLRLARTAGTSSTGRPKTLVDLAKREAKAHANFLRKPARQPLIMSKVRKAPEGMLNEKRIERQAGIRPIAVRAPAKTWAMEVQLEKERKERETRLLAIKSRMKDSTASNVLTFDDDEEKEEDENASSPPPVKPSTIFKADARESEKDVFGDKPRSRGRPSAPSASLKIATTSAIAPTRSAAPKRRRTGLLSASPGANSRHHSSPSTKPAPATSASPPPASILSDSHSASRPSPAPGLVPTTPSPSRPRSGLLSAPPAIHNTLEPVSVLGLPILETAARTKRKAPDHFMRPNKLPRK